MAFTRSRPYRKNDQAHIAQKNFTNVRHYGVTQTPLARVLACAEVMAETKQHLRQERATLNAFALRREVDRQLKAIEACRRSAEA